MHQKNETRSCDMCMLKFQKCFANKTKQHRNTRNTSSRVQRNQLRKYRTNSQFMEQKFADNLCARDPSHILKPGSVYMVH